MDSIADIRKSIEKQMEEFDIYFKNSMKSKVSLLDKITQYIVKGKGKQMRPMFVFLTAEMLGGTNDSTYRAATLIELLHTATLVHDDVVDDSDKRRGLFSIKGLWKNKIAVLVGDFLLSRGLLLSVEHKDYHLLEIVSNSVREMSEGELLQIEKARNLDITEDLYYEIIRKKTASLIASCCAVGAASVCNDTKDIEKLRLFGEYVGMAFQIKDDLFDYDKYNETGKPVGGDLKEQKFTLPLIYLFNKLSPLEKYDVIYLLKNKKKDKKVIQNIVKKVKESGGIEYAHRVMKEYDAKAIEILNTLPDNIYRENLKKLVHFTTNRNI